MSTWSLNKKIMSIVGDIYEIRRFQPMRNEQLPLPSP